MLKGKLYHKIPPWIEPGSRFHIRIRIGNISKVDLTTPVIAQALVSSINYYHEHMKWYAWLAVLMPDHLHAILSFPVRLSMSKVIGEWKKFHASLLHIEWQSNYFDHRLRNDEEYTEKAYYVRMNPVRAQLCLKSEDWPWVVEPWKKAVATELDGYLWQNN